MTPLRNAEPEATGPRFRLYRLCACGACGGTGKGIVTHPHSGGLTPGRCSECRGEGRVRELVAECDSPQDVGAAIVTLGREGEWLECPFGLLDTQGEVGQKWLISPWLPSARNISDAGRTLAGARYSKGERDA